LTKVADAYKHQLQVSFLKTELKAKQLYSVYPILFAKFVCAEKEISYLFGSLFAEKINPLGDLDERAKRCSDVKEDGNDFLRKKLLFLSAKVKKMALDVDKKLDDNFVMCLSSKVYNNAKLEDKKHLDEVKNMMQTLEQQMQIELEATETN